MCLDVSLACARASWWGNMRDAFGLLWWDEGAYVLNFPASTVAPKAAAGELALGKHVYPPPSSYTLLEYIA